MGIIGDIPILNINIEIPSNWIANNGDLEKWVKRVADIQKEYGCNCTLSAKVI